MISTSSKENTHEIFEEIKTNLTRGVKDRKHAFHNPVFCNVDQDGGVDSRVVVLRKFDPINMILNFHTDYRSPKVSNLKQNNKSMLVFYDHKLKIQMRIKTTSIINYQNEIAKEMWDKTKLLSRKCYLTSKDPSSLTSLPEDGIPEHLIGKEPEFEESEKGYKNFTVIENKINEIDWLYLEISGHRRLNLLFQNNKPQFQWLIP
jgi:pyridoxine/pyridoxamine 5'-phosphate oxidase|tara:strand:- start:137 stop:748 length:612 start_codon:yes stop_codon:yes gene_type:complete